MRIALFEPDIPQNTGTILRLAACLGVEAHIIEPAGFPTTDRAFRRAGMDYLDHVEIVRHAELTLGAACRAGHCQHEHRHRSQAHQAIFRVHELASPPFPIAVVQAHALTSAGGLSDAPGSLGPSHWWLGSGKDALIER